ncbi:MAG TPA: DUF427 domain-containing protein [Dongiaceae bacterium]|jgi:uncharacterized protein (DUF427 family)|nr:DUF427 domain-containing protein [Dongiaceae bacterium]
MAAPAHKLQGKTPGPDHPIAIQPTLDRVVVKFAGEVIADSTRALTLREAKYPAVQYIPRGDVKMERLVRTEHHTHCPYKGDASYFTVKAGGRTSENAVWSYEQPFEAVGEIADHVAFYPDRVDSIEIIEGSPT